MIVVGLDGGPGAPVSPGGGAIGALGAGGGLAGSRTLPVSGVDLAARADARVWNFITQQYEVPSARDSLVEIDVRHPLWGSRGALVHKGP